MFLARQFEMWAKIGLACCGGIASPLIGSSLVFTFTKISTDNVILTEKLSVMKLHIEHQL